jgi:glycerate-2-kinase
MDSKQQAIQFFKSVLKNVNPREFLPDVVQWNQEKRILSVYDQKFELSEDQKIFVIGTGKASPTMAIAMEQILGSDIEKGFIIAPPDTETSPSKIEMMEGSHPLPDENSEKATIRLLSLIKKIPNDSIVINLLSGGTSALLCKPDEGLSINDFQKTYKILLESGANIHEVNTVRKALSDVKGGRLLSYFNDVTLLDLVISDVPNDELSSIGSGPTTPQEISYDKAFKVLKKYMAWNDLPHDVRNHLADKMDAEAQNGGAFETEDLRNHQQWIVSSASKVAHHTKEMLVQVGCKTTLIEPAWSGLVDEFENHIMNHLKNSLKNNSGKRALIFFGESTVKVSGDGLGGRNQEIALRMAKRLKDFNRSIVFLSAGTDGIDGPTDMAGAVVNQNTYEDAKSNGVIPDEFIENNDSYHFFKKVGGHIKTGPTGNNVMDIQLVLIEK